MSSILLLFERRNIGKSMQRKKIFIPNSSDLKISSALATEIGLNESLVLLQIEAGLNCYINDRYWMKCNIEDIMKIFPFWNKATINQIVGKLIQKGYIIRVNNWLTLNYEKLKELNSIIVVDIDGTKENKQSKKNKPTNKDIIAEIVARYRSIEGITPARSDYPLLGKAYNDYGYDKVLIALKLLQDRIKSGYMPKNTQIYVLGLLKKIKEKQTGKVILDKRTEKQVNEIFSYYIANFKDIIPTKITLTPERKRKIADRLKEGYSVNFIKKAIYNIRKSPYHCGNNSKGFFWADIAFVCRNKTRLEEWANKIITPKIKMSNEEKEKIEEMLKTYKTKYGA